MRVLTLCYEYPPVGGGGGRMAHNIAAALVRRGHQVRVQTARISGLPKYEIRDGVEIFRTFSFRRRADLCTVPEMAGYLATSFLPSLRHIGNWRPDIIHAHFAVPTGALALACRAITGKPYVLTAHLGDLPGGNPDQTDALFRVLNPLIRPVWTNASGISASSSFAAGLARAAYWVAPEMILNGIPMPGRPDAARPPSQPLELAAIGRFNPQKNFPWMLRALAGCDFPWRLALVGDGAQRGEIEAAVREAGLGGRVRLLGWVAEDALRDVLARADILLMPSTSEGNPIAAIEALKRGVAILGSDIGGLSDLIEDGRNGFAVSLAAPAAFQEKLSLLAADPTLLHGMKSCSLEISKRFDLESIAEKFEALLQEAISSPIPARSNHSGDR
ncbi:MAG: glycosyltransferase family 4 protein [Verrucomicrobiae bacterium]